MEDEENYTYKLISHLRKAQREFFRKGGLEGAFWCVDLTVYEMDSSFENPLKKVVDYDVGFDRFNFTKGAENDR